MTPLVADMSKMASWLRSSHLGRHPLHAVAGLLALGGGLLASAPAQAATTHPATSHLATTARSTAAPTADAPFAVGISPGGAILAQTPSAVSAELASMAAAGDKWVRIDVPWVYVEPSPGSYSWSATDTALVDAVNDGLTVDAILDYAPGWATSLSGQPNASDFASFATAAVKRYAPIGVHVWEVWNEENLGWTWNDAVNVTSYGRLLEAGYKAIHSADRQAVVLLGGLGRGPNLGMGLSIDPYDYLAQLYAGGFGRYFDAVALHPYSAPVGPTSTSPYNVFAQLPQFRSLMVAYGDSAKKIWVTEYGFPTGVDPDAVTEADQATWLAQAITMIEGQSWAGPFFVYNWQDDAVQSYGLLRADGSAKPAFSVFVESPH